jgi:hypothetical protein
LYEAPFDMDMNQTGNFIAGKLLGAILNDLP